MIAILSLGMVIFSIPTLAYQEMQRKADYRFARNGRIGARDAAQFVGPGDETISLSGTAHAELSDGEASLDQLRAIAARGTALPLVCANGRVYGTYVVTAIDERSKLFDPDGTPRVIDFGLDLLRVDDASASARV